MTETNTALNFLDSASREFKRLKQFADRSFSLLSEEDFFRKLDGESNSVAIIVKHVSGNMRSRWTDFLTSDGEKPDRHRDSEFETLATDTREKLLHDWEEGWKLLFTTIENLEPSELLSVVKIRGEQHTVIDAIMRQVPHYGFHVGQIVILVKHFARSSWSSLTIEKGKSEDFNANPPSYLDV